MKLKFALTFFSALSSVFAAVSIPKGTGLAVINIPDNSGLRVYHQDSSSGGIKEIATKQPTTGVLNDALIYNGSTRVNSPLAAVSWANGKTVEVSRSRSQYYYEASSEIFSSVLVVDR